MEKNDKIVTVALVVAGGRGERLGGPRPKQYQNLAGIPLRRHTLLAFCHHPRVKHVATVIREEDREFYEMAANGLELLPPIVGGASRQESVRNGLRELQNYQFDSVLIHDGARPFVSRPIIDNVLDGLINHIGAIAAVPLVDSLKRGVGGVISSDIPRDDLWQAQTPQGFQYDAILNAHENATTGHTDDASIACASGMDVILVEGSRDNVKITTANDLTRAEAANAAGLSDVRFGQGFDVHRFESGDSVRLCGINIPHFAKLAGHSDADVALHSVTDAILGAINDGDIGRHFPPGEAEWKNRDSAHFVRFALDRVRKIGGRLEYVDLTIICEKPKITPHHNGMANRLAAIAGLEPHRVSIKATTTEGLGITGRNEGIAAHAIATVRLPR